MSRETHPERPLRGLCMALFESQKANHRSMVGNPYLTLPQAGIANNEDVRVASRGHLAVPARTSEQPQDQTGLRVIDVITKPTGRAR